MKLRNLSYYLVLAVAGSFVMPIAINSICIGLFTLTALLSADLRKDLVRLKKITFILPVLLFVVMLAGVLNSTNTTEAWHYAERKLTLLLFPLAFTFFPVMGNEKYFTTLRVYILSIVLAGTVCLVLATAHFTYNNDWHLFTYHNLSQNIHINAIYLSAYCLFALILLQEYRSHIFKSNTLTLVLQVFFAGLLLLLSSKMVLALGLLYALWRVFASKHLPAARKILTTIVLSLVAVAVLWLTPFIRERVLVELQSNMQVVQQRQYSYNTPFSGSSLRMVLWKHSLHILNREHAWLAGTGTGDFQELLNNTYRQTGMFCGDPRRGDSGYLGYNPHNQYIEFLLATGFIGLFLFAFWLFTLFKQAAAGNHRPLFLLLIIFASMCVSECLFSANKGITWFLFFTCLFVNWPLFSPQKPSVTVDSEQLN